MNKKFLAAFWMILLAGPSRQAWGLAIDEKLTLRFLSVSATKKTVLINRGMEDGLVVGDHAKFFLTTGVIARGVVVKASPSRSIWSLYRLVNPNEIATDKVVDLKIADPVKITEDPSKMLSEQHSLNEAGVESLVVPVARGDDRELKVPRPAAKSKELSSEEMKELSELSEKSSNTSMGSDIPVERISHASGMGSSSWNLELWGLLYLNALSTSVDTGTGAETSGNQSFINFSLGFEKYFTRGQSWARRLSLYTFLNSTSQELQGLERGESIKETALDFGLGANVHFYNDVVTYGAPILFVGTSFGLGKCTDSVDVSTPTVPNSTTFDGTSNFMSLGTGVKYYTSFGLGARLLFDYFRRAEKYEVTGGAEFAKVVHGPRFLVGVSYRW